MRLAFVGGMSIDDYDSPWRGILDRYFPAFISFFFPEIDKEIDWLRDYESLDKELEQVTRDAELGRCYADKLMKVWRRDGDQQVVYIHVEAQAQPEEVFAPRMHVYHYRIFDRYKRPVVNLAIQAGDRTEWWPDRFGYEAWGSPEGGQMEDCQAGVRYPIVKLWDYKEKWHALAASDNPFATVVMAHLKTLATGKDADARMRWKMAMYRRLYESGSERQEVLDLLRFVDWVMWLPPELKGQFEETIEEYEAEKKLEYLTTFERRGLAKGLAKGLEKGIQQGQAAVLKRLLKRRFDDLPAWAEERLRGATREQLESWADQVLEAKRLEDVFDS